MGPLIAAVEVAAGVLLLAGVAGSVARTLLVPRNRSSRLQRWALRAALGGVRVVPGPGGAGAGRLLLADLAGPAALLAVLLGWLLGLLAGFGLLAAPVRPGADPVSTLLGRDGAEAGRGPALLAAGFWLAAGTVVVCFGSYLAVLAAAHGRRERTVSRLAIQAVRPLDADDLLVAYLHGGTRPGVNPLLAEWRDWFSDVHVTHTAYPVLVSFPCNAGLCWLEAMVIMLDAAALVDALVPSLAEPHARALLRAGTVCLSDLAGGLGLSVPLPAVSLQGREERDFLDTVGRARGAGLATERDPQQAWSVFQGWRQAYAPQASALAARLLCFCPPYPTVEAIRSGRVP